MFELTIVILDERTSANHVAFFLSFNIFTLIYLYICYIPALKPIQCIYLCPCMLSRFVCFFFF